MFPRIARPVALLLVTLAGFAGAAQASSLVLDPTRSTIQIEGAGPAPLFGKIETELFETEPPPLGPGEVYEIKDILLRGGGQTISGPDVSKFEFMGLLPLLRPLPAVTLGAVPSFALTANFEVLEVDGDRALFSYLQLSAVGPEAVQGTSMDGVLTSLWVDATVTLKVAWWEKRFLEPCTSIPCLSFPPSIWPDETVLDQEIGNVSFHAGAPIPEPQAAALFATGFALVGWSIRGRRVHSLSSPDPRRGHQGTHTEVRRR